MAKTKKTLDEILDIFHNKMLALETITNPCDEPSDEIERTFDEAKAAITSLIKELAAEAKPERRELGADEFQLTNAMNNGYNNSLDEFEQNLLKALEEA